jgi:hypothetical protein
VYPPPYRYEVAIIPKGGRAEVRVALSLHKGRHVADVRVYWQPTADSAHVPTRRGITIDARKLGELVEALTAARDEFARRQTEPLPSGRPRTARRRARVVDDDDGLGGELGPGPEVGGSGGRY